MVFSKRSIAAVLLSILFVSSASAQIYGDPSAPTLFLVNDKPVKTSEFVYLYRKNHQDDPGEFTKEKIEEYLGLFINYKLKVEEALQRRMDTTAAFKKEFKTYKDELLKPFLPEGKVIDSLVALTYERLKEEVHAAHILIQVKPDATPADTLRAFEEISQLRQRALAGEDFGTLAAQYSDEPAAEKTHGDLGYFTAMQMVYPFEQAAYTTPVGEISLPVRTKYGYHIIKVLDRRPSQGEVEVSHILIATGDGADDKAAKDAIFDVYDKLQKGMKWEEVCRQYSEDPNTKDKGGKLRPFGVGTMNAVPEFQEMAFALHKKGEISDPFQTQFGWHILRLESRIPLPSLDEMKGSLTQRVSRDERATISRQALRKRLKAEFDYRENAGVVSKLVDRADTTLTNGKWHPRADEAFRNQVLFTLQDQPYTVNGFFNFAATQQVPAQGAPAEVMKQLIEKFADAMQIAQLEAKILKESPDYKWLLNEYYEGILLFEIMEKEVWNRAMDDSVGQRDYFNANAGKYMAGQRIDGTLYTSSRENLAHLKTLLESSDSAAARFISAYRIKSEKGPFEKSDRSVLATIKWSPGAYLAENNGTNYLIAVEKILPPGPKTFEEARTSVITDYQTYLEDAWIKELKAKFGVKVIKKAKRDVLRQLSSKR